MNNFYQDFECLQTFSLDQKTYYRYGNYCNIAIAPKSNKIVTGLGEKSLEVWDLATGNFQVLKGHTKYINSVALSLDETIVISASQDGSIKFWDLMTGECIQTRNTDCQYFICALVSPSNFLVTSEWKVADYEEEVDCLWYDTFRVLDLEANHWSITFKAPVYAFNSLAIAPNGNIIVAGTCDNTLVVWDVNKQEEFCSIKLGGLGTQEVYRTAIAPNGDTVAVADGNTVIKICNLSSQSCNLKLHGHEKPITSLAISLDGKTLVSGSYDKTIKIWDLETGKCVKTLADLESDWAHNGYTAIALSPDEKFIVSASQSNSTVRIWGIQ